jgi:formamidopyrimidine-DNA glycosylase
VPELPEVEGYRALAEQAIGRRITGVDAPDAWYLKRGLDADAVEGVLIGRRLLAARRRGKLMLLDWSGPGRRAGDPELVLGVHFGMSGRLIVNGRASVERLLYTSAGPVSRLDPSGLTGHDRFRLRFSGGGTMVVRDPRRLGGVEVDPDEDRLGPDALGASLGDLRRALSHTTVAVKARMLDQSRLAGVGNLIADEILWRAGLAPARPCDSLTDADVRRLHHHLTRGLQVLIRRGGSHTGDLQPQRRSGGECPRDRTPLNHGQVGGRTTWWCPRHQH